MLLLYETSWIMDLIICFCWVAFTDPVESYSLLGKEKEGKSLERYSINERRRWCVCRKLHICPLN